MNVLVRLRALACGPVALSILFVATSAHAESVAVLSVESENARARHDYMLNCMGCHQRDGVGVEDKVPSLVGLDRHFDSPRGREYLIRVPGVSQSGLSDARLTVLMNWALARFGNRSFEPYTESEVARWRADPLRTSTEIDGIRPADSSR